MSKIKLLQSESSFRDPSGYIFLDEGNNIYRTITKAGKHNFDLARESGLHEKLAATGKLISYTPEDPDKFEALPAGTVEILSHPSIPFISYPYEWTFEQLREAALLHLDVHLAALESGMTLSDATAYNIQFIGHKPVFIDLLSFTEYKEGLLWKAQQQFVEQFLSPLLLWSLAGIPHNDWYKGTLKGINPAELNNALPLRKKLSFKYLNYIYLPCYFENKEVKGDKEAKPVENKLPKTAMVFILQQLRKWIAGLKSPHGATVWSDYMQNRSYDDKSLAQKAGYISEKIKEAAPAMLWDIGCNTGEFSMLALQSGAQYVVGLELDHGALASAYAGAKAEKAAFLPLYTDLSNPSGDIGWAQQERQGLQARSKADFALSLAVIHHIVIGNNVPLQEALRYLVSLAPEGIIEWVPKSDSMIRRMLLNRDDIFLDYDEENFAIYLKQFADIKDIRQVTDEGRKLYLYKRK